MRPIACAIVLVFLGAQASAESASPVRFSTEEERLDLTPDDVEEARPWFDNGSAGINLLLTDAAAERLGDLTRRSVGEVMTFSVCGTDLISATVQAPIESGAIGVVTEGLGTAAWYAQMLRGEVGCDRKPVE